MTNTERDKIAGWLNNCVLPQNVEQQFIREVELHDELAYENKKSSLRTANLIKAVVACPKIEGIKIMRELPW